VQLSSRYPLAHGTPVHIGDPKEIGIEDIGKNEFGHSTQIEDDEIPVFWACGVTPQMVCLIAKPEFMITHYPAKMFVSDQPIPESALMS
jgi:uncharacterized protein YcsI (UPF0317 family)